MSLADALLEAAPDRLPPLVKAGHGDAQVRQVLDGQAAEDLFPGARSARGALAGLYFYFGCWDEAHEAAQGEESAEGAYWHGILHRQEPDPANANYWFRRVSGHPVQRALAERYGSWDAAAFVKFCAGAKPGSDDEQQAREKQLAEWRLLYEYCKEPV